MVLVRRVRDGGDHGWLQTRRGAIPTICPDIADALADVLVSSLDLLRNSHLQRAEGDARAAGRGGASTLGRRPTTHLEELKPQVMAEQSVAMENSDRLKSNVRWKLAGRPEDLGPQAGFPIPLLAQ